MRINPIQKSYYSENTKYSKNKFDKQYLQQNSNYISDRFDRTNKIVSFGNIRQTALMLAKQIPLEDRIASLFDIFKRGDIITVGKNIQETQKALKDSLDAFDHIIKRIFFIEEDVLNGNLAFLKNATGEKEIVNINDFDIYLRGDLGNYKLKPHESFYILPGDHIKINDTDMQIKNEPKINLSMQRHIFSKVFDFTETSKDIIKAQNKKELATLSKDKKNKTHPITFADVGGQDKVIDTLKREVLYPIKYPEAFEDIKVNHGIILTGPPGTGKTLIAEALANESNAYFTKLNGSELKSKWVGESEENLRNFFNDAIERQPSIVVFDEFDSVAKKRDQIDNYSAEFVNQFLSIMSDIEKHNDDVFVLATTNKIDLLDDAIMRSGRFGKHINVGIPDLKGTKQIFDIHTENKNLDKSINKDILVQKLHDIKATGADISRLVSDAHNNAFDRLSIFEKMNNGTFKRSDIDNLSINYEDFEKAINSFMSENKIKERKKIGYN